MATSPVLDSSHVDHAAWLGRLAFRGLSPQDAYDLAFYGHFLTTDPAGRVPTFLGTNQRDTIRPALRRHFQALPENGVVVDIAAGDGSTVLPAIDADVKAKFILVEPSAEAVGEYLMAIESSPNLEMQGLPLAIDANTLVDNPVWQDEIKGGFDLSLCVHGIYFLDLPRVLRAMYRGLRPGGVAVIVHADELRGMSGAAMERYLRRTKRDDEADAYLDGLRARHRMLSAETGEGTVTELLLADGQPAPEVEIETIESSAFAPTLEGLSAIGLIAGLSYTHEDGDGPMDETKANALLEVIVRNPERVDFGVVTDPADPRCGMYRVRQPQRVVSIRKPSAG
jgi:SAM-dependent methyltransferase